MDHDRTEAVLTDIKLSQDHDFDLPLAVLDALSKAADLIRDLRVKIGNQETRIVDLEEKAGAAAEPAAWQSRVRIGGHWSKWREIDGDLGEQKKRMASMAEQGKFEVRPLYAADNAALIAAAPQMVEALEAWQQWEADIIMNSDCWPAGSVYPFRVTRALYNKMIEIQSLREAALASIGRKG